MATISLRKNTLFAMLYALFATFYLFNMVCATDYTPLQQQKRFEQAKSYYKYPPVTPKEEAVNTLTLDDIAQLGTGVSPEWFEKMYNNYYNLKIGGITERIYIDWKGNGMSKINYEGPWVQIRYKTRDSILLSRDNSQHRIPDKNSETTFYKSKEFGFEQNEKWIDGLLGKAIEVRQFFFSDVKIVLDGLDRSLKIRGHQSLQWPLIGIHMHQDGLERISKTKLS